jgi:hypothetical protein
MDEYLRQIRSYLPIKFADDETNELVEYLGEAYLENLEKNKFQFSFTAFHMLNMIFIYKVKWFLKQQGNTSIESDLQSYSRSHNGITFNSLFDLSQFPEKTSLEKLLQALDFHPVEIGISKNHVQVRNNCSHASGKIYYKKRINIEHYIEEELDSIKKIQEKLTPSLANLMEVFLNQNWDKSLISGDIKQFFMDSYLSEKDLEQIIDTPQILNIRSDTEESIYKKILYLVTVYEAQELLDNNQNSFLQKLPILMNGLVEKIDVIRDSDVLELQTTGIIEEFLSPILSSFSDVDRNSAESILEYN